MEKYRNYIKSHIFGFNGQASVNWNTPGYRSRLDSIASIYKEKYGTDDLASCIKSLAEHGKINRDYIFSLFKQEEWYKGYVATMLWGKISLSRNNDLSKNNGYRALIIKKEDIEDIIQELLPLNTEEELKAAFTSLAKGGAHKIYGVSLSYFTKLLFFLSPSLTPKPLIYDKWGIRIHAALLKDKGEEFSLKLNIYAEQPYVVKGQNIETLFNSYKEYCTLVNNLHKELGIPDNVDIDAFLFGKDLNEKNPDVNARKWLVDYLEIGDTNNNGKNKQSLSFKRQIQYRIEHGGVLKYSLIDKNNNEYAIMSGKVKTKYYCVILSPNKQYPMMDLLSPEMEIRAIKSYPYLRKDSSDNPNMAEKIKDALINSDEYYIK